MSHTARLLAFNDDDKHYERLHMETTPNGNCLMVVDDESNSSLNTIEAQSVLTASRLSNVQDWIGTSDGTGGGVKTGVNIAEILVDTDQCVSKLTDISTNASLTSSRLSNVQDWIGTSDGTGGGVKTGVNISSLAGCVAGNELQVDIVSGSVTISGGATEAKQDTQETTLNAIETLLTASNVDLAALEVLQTSTNTKLGTIETDVEATNTLLTTMDGVLDNILTKNTEIDTAIDTQISLNNYIGSQANLMNGVSCVAAGQDSSVVDWGSTRCPKRVQITAVATSSTSGSGMEVWGSHDNSTWCVMTIGNSKTITLNTTESDGSAINSQCGIVTDWCMRYMKIRIYCLATFTATAIGNI